MRIFQACDPHGSQQTWEKMCRAPKAFKADVAMMCGDLTGKAIMPIIQEKEDRWYANPRGDKKTFKKQKDLDKFIKFTKDEGFYPVVLTPDELAKLQETPGDIKKLFDKLMSERMQEWMDMANERIPEEIMVVVNPGNDDDYVIDEIIKNDERIIYPLERVVDVRGYPMISLEWVNSTPWDTHRECSEEELLVKLEAEFARLDTDDYSNVLCNFHDPPYNSGLDVAPKLTEDYRVAKAGAHEIMAPVGSKSVRAVIEKYQPLLGMHGHIHESVGYRKIGETLCVNPGSEYREGILKGFLITIEDGKVQAGRVEL
ncbi:MAG: metallophosphoesterase family protein [Candidatus Thorarchaeota archaeon]|jgi:Icc-related predicted phosphoesterase